ncbi:MAG: DegT/DnrJ/EryC1/StrS family aminotransferase [Chlamydiota bacterium]|nr:DegT/DnrJ/EryC1/StrS family aminotransferase [Chlamydiota bacterium]
MDVERVKNVLKSIFLTTGTVTAEFEKKFAGYTGLKEVVGVNSCTAALHLSLLALGIGPGDEVITTPMTFIATATSILHAGAKPVFVDVEKDTGLIDINTIEKAITSRTKAIISVHLYGTMADMAAIKDIADRYNLKIIEDCAHCIEGERDGIRPGQLSDAACYSFYATKNLTCGEGGAVATNNSELAARLKILRLHGMSKDAANRYTDRYQHWDMLLLGWKYNMSDISAALLVEQIDRLEQYWQRRREVWGRYTEGLSDINGIEIPEIKGKSAMHLYTIWVDPERRDEILHKIQDKGIGVAVNYRAMHTLTYFRENFGFKPDDFPTADLIGRRTISLPFYPLLNDYEVKYIIDSIKKLI